MYSTHFASIIPFIGRILYDRCKNYLSPVLSFGMKVLFHNKNRVGYLSIARKYFSSTYFIERFGQYYSKFICLF